MAKVLAMGDMLVEIMREEIGQGLDIPGRFLGPYPSGAPVIFAGALARLGMDTGFIGSVGNDDFGQLILDRLSKEGVEVSHVAVWENETTGVAFVAYFADGTRKFIYHVGDAAAGKITESQTEPIFLEQFDHLHVMGTALSINSDWQRAVMRAVQTIKRNGGKISFDPNLRPEMLQTESIKKICEAVLDLTDLFLPSEAEIRVFGDPQRLISQGLEAVAIKRGVQGSTIVTPLKKFDIPAFSVDEVDPTGAGDCFGAGFIKGYYEGWGWEKIGRFANAVGALSVTQRGPMEGAPAYQKAIQLMNTNNKPTVCKRM